MEHIHWRLDLHGINGTKQREKTLRDLTLTTEPLWQRGQTCAWLSICLTVGGRTDGQWLDLDHFEYEHARTKRYFLRGSQPNMIGRQKKKSTNERGTSRRSAMRALRQIPDVMLLRDGTRHSPILKDYAERENVEFVVLACEFLRWRVRSKDEADKKPKGWCYNGQHPIHDILIHAPPRPLLARDSPWQCGGASVGNRNGSGPREVCLGTNASPFWYYTFPVSANHRNNVSTSVKAESRDGQDTRDIITRTIQDIGRRARPKC